MINLFLLLFLYGCSQVPIKSPPLGEDLVTIDTALDHIRASYMRGCVEAFKELGMPTSFEHCRDRAKDHQNEVREMIEQTP